MYYKAIRTYLPIVIELLSNHSSVVIATLPKDQRSINTMARNFSIDILAGINSSTTGGDTSKL